MDGLSVCVYVDLGQSGGGGFAERTFSGHLLITEIKPFVVWREKTWKKINKREAI